MAAEIFEIFVVRDVPRVASMRPRRMAAEIPGSTRIPWMRSGASMRPRRMAAEISGENAKKIVDHGSFNEAAANGRGNPWISRTNFLLPFRLQ